MANGWQSMTNFAVSLPNRPGELARFAERLRESGINLLGLWGYASGADEPWISCVPESPEKFRDFAALAGLECEEGEMMYLSADDRPGALVRTLRRIATAGVNIDAIESVASGGRFGCFIWADEENWDQLAAVLDEAGSQE